VGGFGETIEITLRLVKASLLRTGLPVPAPRDVVYSWARGTGLPGRGETYIYTGGLYQLAPYIRANVEALEALRRVGVLWRLAGRLGEAAVGRLPLHLAFRPPKREVERARRVVRSIARMVASVSPGVAYLYERDLYPGTIAYEYGLDDVFQVQAMRVAKAVKSAGAKRLVTIDPHTTRILRSVIPEYVDGFDTEVVSYLELLDEAGYQPPRLKDEAVIHDPCLYARFEGVVEQPRRLLERAGLRLKEPGRSRRLTYCCGGPIEGIMPELSKKIARVRAEELLRYSSKVLVLCPICYVNLEPQVRGRGTVIDVAEYLSGEAGASV